MKRPTQRRPRPTTGSAFAPQEAKGPPPPAPEPPEPPEMDASPPPPSPASPGPLPAPRPTPAPPPDQSSPTVTGSQPSVERPAPRDVEIFAGRYRVERRLGRGGMGSVYLATQLVVDRKVAIKVLESDPDDAVMKSRFSREARVIAQLQHPNVVQLIDFGEDERGQLFLVMEYIDGEPLKDLIAREAPLEPARVVHIGLQLADALAAAHAMGVIHRDLKPDNVMLPRGATSRRDFPKVLDFGIAKVIRADRSNDTVKTQAGLIVGSLRYISPEQVESGTITPQTDLYALGCILYELLAGRRVFEYASPADCAVAHLTERPAPPSRDGAPLAGPLVELIMRCLDKAPSRRPASAAEVVELLNAAASQPVVPESAPVDAPDASPTLLEADAPQAEPTHSALPAPSPLAPPAPPPVGRRPITDCGLVRPGPGAGPRSAAPDLALGRPTGRPASALASESPGRAMAHTGTHTHAVRPAHTTAAPGRRAGLHPVLIALGLIALAAIGAVFTIFIIVPATTSGPAPAPDRSEPAPPSTTERSTP